MTIGAKNVASRVEPAAACPAYRSHQRFAPRLHRPESSIRVPELSLSDRNFRIVQSRIRGSGVTVAAQVLGTCARKGVGVRVPPSAPLMTQTAQFEFRIRTYVLHHSVFDTNSDTNWVRQHAIDGADSGCRRRLADAGFTASLARRRRGSPAAIYLFCGRVDPATPPTGG